MSTEQSPREAGANEPAIADLNYLTFSMSSRATYRDGEQSETKWNLAIYAQSDDEDRGDPTLWMEGWTFDTFRPSRSLRTWLDDVDADTSVFCPVVTDDGSIEGMSGFGSNLVLVNHVLLDRKWRGRGGVGLFLTGLGIKQLWADAACVALHPSPFELRRDYPDGQVPDDVWADGVTRLTAHWQRLGFRPLRGSLVLDPTLIRLDRALTRLASELGVAYTSERDYDDEDYETDD